MALKTISIVGVLATLLIAVGVVVVIQNKRKEDTNIRETNASEKAIKVLCQNTYYKETCVDSLTRSTNSSDPKTLIQTSFQVAMGEIDNVIKKLAPIQEASKDAFTARGYEICQKFLYDSIYDLQRTLDRTNTFEMDNFGIVMDDIKTWLSGALTYQETCLDTLEESKADAELPKVREFMQPARELTINGFGMADEFSRLLPPYEEKRRLNLVLPDDATRTHRFLRVQPGKVTPHVVVAKDGSGKYRTISEALREVPFRSNDTFVIHIKEGVYQEYVNITSAMWSVMLLGDGPTKTRITGSKSYAANFQTFDTATLFISGDNFIGKDIGIENTAGPGGHQAAAVIANSDKSLFYNCQLDGYQDTLCTHNYRQFYRDCTISGTIDFIFGNARAVFQNCTLIVRKPGPEQKSCMVTAQGKNFTNETTGIVIQSSRIIPALDYPVDDKILTTYLGRPWRPFSTTVIMDSELDAIIDPHGWSDWNSTTGYLATCFFAEMNNRGPGADLAKRNYTFRGIRKISKRKAEQFTVGKFLSDYWINGLGIPYSSGRMISH